MGSLVSGPSVRRLSCALLLAAAVAVAPVADAQVLHILDTVCDIDFPSCTEGVQGLRGVREAVLSPDGAHIYFAVALDDALLAFDYVTGPGDEELAFLQSIFDTDPGINGLDSARGIAISPDGKHVYVAALLDSSLAAFSRETDSGDPDFGKLSFVEVEVDGVGGVDGLAGAHSVRVSPDGEHVYVAARSEDAVSVFARDDATGAVTFLQVLKDGVGGVEGLDAAEAIRVSPDGKHVYVAAETDDAVAVFSRETDSGDPDFGKLTFVEALYDGVGGVDGLNGANNLALDPAGDHLYVACERGAGGGDWIAVFSRDSVTGELTFVDNYLEEDFAPYTGCSGVGPDNSGVVVRPDGGAVFATNPFRGTVAWFDRDPVTGELTLATKICDQNFGIDGIAGAVAVTTNTAGNRLVVSASSFEIVALLTTETPIFSDGFESGDTSAWSNALP